MFLDTYLIHDLMHDYPRAKELEKELLLFRNFLIAKIGVVQAQIQCYTGTESPHVKPNVSVLSEIPEVELIDKLRDYVKRMGGQQKAATTLELSRATISLILKGKRGLGPKVLRNISKLFTFSNNKPNYEI